MTGNEMKKKSAIKKKGVITGATGYIGSHLLKYLLLHDWDISIIAQPEFGYDNIQEQIKEIRIVEYDGNIQTLISFFKKENPDVVFHLAAAVITNYTPEQISTLIQSNIQFGTEVLEAMKFSTTRLFINTGSYWQNCNSDVYSPVDLYAATKESFEKILQYYVEVHDFRAITLRLFDVYGEDDKRPKLLNLLFKIAETGQSIDVSPGEQLLDMVHISDVCSAYLKAYDILFANSEINHKIYGVYTGNRMKLKDMIDLFQSILQKPLNVNFGGKTYKKREIMIPTTRYEILPCWEAKITLSYWLSVINGGGGNIM
ncbi:MAG: NAD-dependent epimerase/dehydratase family protein [Prevotellaceae bacterium]|jgi:CDP-3, 6-dideoxy-D-glycero-L-glycero-4-hexulose-4-reductase|nr:NAD-dependent epimerase/dehydratase family protein [Prevotellaceae bacterium]